ncbi:MAG: hypothetical protein M3396_10580 [Actinomycetota bacterium]|nr:hypothetical protein [Actinomycetota bacterium]
MAAGGVACGDDTIATKTAVEGFNRAAEPRDVRLMCPEEIDKGVKEMDCTLQGTKTGKTAAVKMEAISDESEFLETTDGAAFRNAVEQVTQP